ncbi:MAG TPA: flavodoxin domain-containing protein, partial [Trebonia sp.]|nr:flavodoxin domain-containing protein [Trebonia sp.]
RAVVVYESMYGNTHQVAEAIGAGLEPACSVTVVPVSQVTAESLAGADLVVVGGPTHLHGMSRAATRKSAAGEARKPGSGLELDPDASGPGLREWLGSLGRHQAKAAAFDTRLHGPGALTGRASKGVARSLRAHGFDLAAKPESFLVTRKNQLDPRETERARAWGSALAATIAPRLARDTGSVFEWRR